MSKAKESRSMRLSISRSSDGDQFISVYVTGEHNSDRICRLTVGLKEFALAWTGRGFVECDGEIWTDSALDKLARELADAEIALEDAGNAIIDSPIEVVIKDAAKMRAISDRLGAAEDTCDKLRAAYREARKGKA